MCFRKKAKNGIIYKVRYFFMKKVEIYTEYIKLEQMLKIADIVSTGGEAKLFLLTNDIYVNDEVENRRGRKLYKGDIVKVNGNLYQIC